MVDMVNSVLTEFSADYGVSVRSLMGTCFKKRPSVRDGSKLELNIWELRPYD